MCVRLALLGSALILAGCWMSNPAFDERREGGTTSGPGSETGGSGGTASGVGTQGVGSGTLGGGGTTSGTTSTLATAGDGSGTGMGTGTNTVGTGGGVQLGFACGSDEECVAGAQCCSATQCLDTCMIPCSGGGECPPTMGCHHGYCLFPCQFDDADCEMWPGYTCQHLGNFCENDMWGG